MKPKENLCALYHKLDAKWFDQFGFNIKDITLDKIVDYMYTPKDSSSLAVTRILFGLAMLFDIPDERGGASMTKRWGDRQTCHFPLLPILQPMPLPYMALVYAALWIGAVGIMLGYKFSITAPMFTVCYWYLFLIEKTFWNNHSYLFGLVALLICCTDAACYWSLDAYLDPSKKKQTVPYWNYFILKYQFFILYFMAGMKKGTAEWLTGYSVQNLSEHWVFDPFKYFLTVPQTDYLVVHWFIFLFDLTVAVWMMWSYTRHVAMVFCALFHLMNSRLFRIGMFPWVCLATMPLFYPFDWPKRLALHFKHYSTNIRAYILNKKCEFNNKHICECPKDTTDDKNTELNKENSDLLLGKDKEVSGKASEELATETHGESNDKATNTDEHFYQDCGNGDDITDYDDHAIKNTSNEKRNFKKKTTVLLIAFYVFVQAFLPYSHFLTKGYNNWTEGLYGYSWDMMVHTWDSSSIVVKVVDNNKNVEMYIDPELYTLNDRWSRHGDMVYQYAQCLKNNFELYSDEKSCDDSTKLASKNISIYVDIWCGMNGRFIQRMFDPKVDLLKANWTPFSEVSYLMPLLDEAIHWRKDLDKIRQEVYSWSNFSDVVFFADFPGYEQEKFIPLDFQNVTLSVLEGTVIYEPEVVKNEIGQSYKLITGNHIKVNSGWLHKVLNIGDKPAFYMYTFLNVTETNIEKDQPKPKLPIVKELYRRFYGMIVFGNLVLSNIFQIFKFPHCN